MYTLYSGTAPFFCTSESQNHSETAEIINRHYIAQEVVKSDLNQTISPLISNREKTVYFLSEESPVSLLLQISM